MKSGLKDFAESSIWSSPGLVRGNQKLYIYNTINNNTIKYKYTNGAAGEGFTGTEEWPGNARILEIKDVLTSRSFRVEEPAFILKPTSSLVRKREFQPL